MPRKFIDLTGQKFGRLTVIRRAENKGKSVCWLCKCDCGNEVEVRSADLRNGMSKSCGCLRDEVASKQGKQRIGEKHHNYNHNLTKKEREQGRNIDGYSDWKQEVKRQANYTCDICGQRGGKLHSHHLDGYKWCKTRRRDLTNGVCLCEHCHKDFHHHYGVGHNTEEEYLEYKYSYKNN